MAISFVQSKVGATNTVNASATFTSNVSIGNTIIVTVAFTSGTTVPSIRDSQSNIYQQVISQTSSTPNTVQIWFATNVNEGPTTVTPNYTGAGKSGITIYEFSGLGTAKTDQTNFGTGATGVPASTAIATTVANELIFAAEVDLSGGVTVGTGYSNFLEVDYLPLSSNATLGSQTQIVSSTGSYNGAFGGSNTTAWVAVIASFYASPVIPHAKFNNSGLRPHPFSPGLAR